METPSNSARESARRVLPRTFAHLRAHLRAHPSAGRLARPLVAVALALASALPAAAQLDLPEQDRPRKRPRAPVSGLDLPDQRPAPKTPEAEPESGSAPEAAPAPSTEPEVAQAILTDLQRVRDVNGPEVRRAVEELVALGEAGRLAARVGLLSKHESEVVAAARVLLRGGQVADRNAVDRRIGSRVPSRAAKELVKAFVDLAPVAAGPAWLVELLDHEQGSVRAAAFDRLQERVEPELIPLLGSALSSSRTDTRVRAVELLSIAGGERAREAMLELLGDESGRVARSVAEFLAGSTAPGLEERLVELVTEETFLDRRASFALLAIVEREDAFGRAILGEELVEPLLSNLTVESPLTVGAAACALAGIGFRSRAVDDASWLDLLVPHHLVRAVAAVTYHKDFGALQQPAQRRLALISGQDFGASGPAWQGWWREAAPSFRARRAFLTIGPDNADELRLVYRSADEHLVLEGDLAVRPTGADPSQAIVITREECLDLVRVLEREGVLSAERLPTLGASRRELRVAVAGREKRYALDGAAGGPWAERIAQAARAVAEANAWQRWVDPVVRRAEAREWREERAFWREVRDPLARARREKGLVLDALPTLEPARQRAAVERLGELARIDDVLLPVDVQRLLQALGELRSSPYLASTLTRVAVTAARGEATSTDEPASVLERRIALDGGEPIDEAIALQLVDALTRRFGVEAHESVAAALAARPVEDVLPLARDRRSVVRAGVADALRLADDGSSEAVLIALLGDREARVEVAAIESLGARRSAAAIDAVLTRAIDRDDADETAVPRTPEERALLRVAALGAVARSGDPRAVGALLPALSADEPAVRRAAAEGMAGLEDPAVAPILVSMLARGPEAEVFSAARDGLRRLGEDAQLELLRAVNRRQAGLSREAALLLAEQGVPQVAASLIAMFTESPDDPRVGWELAVLSCIDPRDEPEPADAWWSWWDLVVHDDSIAWLLAAGERAGVRAPDRSAFEGRGTRAAAAFLVELAAVGEPHVRERARRELSERLGREVDVDVDSGLAYRQALEAILDEGWAEPALPPVPVERPAPAAGTDDDG